jgi:hypothetical protein
MPDSQPFVENRDAGTLALAIVDTVREPLLVLDKDITRPEQSCSLLSR